MSSVIFEKGGAKMTKTSPPRKKRGGYCIAHNPLLFQPLGHWFTLIYRKCEHLAVWVIGSRSYWLSWALPFGIASSLTTFILYHKLFSLSIPFFAKSYIFPRRYLARTSWFWVFLLFVPLLYHTLRVLSRVFYIFLRGALFFIFAFATLCQSALSSWHPYCIIDWVVCQGEIFPLDF